METTWSITHPSHNGLAFVRNMALRALIVLAVLYGVTRLVGHWLKPAPVVPSVFASPLDLTAHPLIKGIA